jgi:SOS response regulatory protein OraA/RecX
VRRDRSRLEVDACLEQAGVAEGARAEAIETLERIGYVDDSRFAFVRAQALGARGRGDEAILHDLAGRGIEGDVAAAALAALEPERERAASVAARLGRSAKTAALLARRGFDPDSIEAAVGPDVAPGSA